MDFSQYSSIQSQVDKIKEKMFSSTCDPYSFISPSAYDTAWLAMIPDPHQPLQPMFKNCLDWVLYNQNEQGFWGECDAHGMPTINCLPSTLACIVALKKWNTGGESIKKGLAFVHANTEKLIREMNKQYCGRWFAIVFPAMVELANTVVGEELVFPDSLIGVVSELFNKRQQILEKEELVDMHQNSPLLAYLEALPTSYDIDKDVILNQLSNDGSLFQSPSAIASAFMATGSKECMAYLVSLVQRYDNGVPRTYPMDEDLINLCMVNQLVRLGIAEHFVLEIEEILEQVYRNYLNQEAWPKSNSDVAAQLLKNSLAFCLLRMHGYSVSSDIFCWFLNHEDIRVQIENNHEYFSSALLNVYRATDLMFSGEDDLQEARSFSKQILEKILSVGTRDQTHLSLPNLRRVLLSFAIMDFHSTLQSQVDKIKEKMFSSTCDPYSFILLPLMTLHERTRVLGECDAHGMPTINCLPSTLACIVALKSGILGRKYQERRKDSSYTCRIGLVHANTEKLIREMNKQYCGRCEAKYHNLCAFYGEELVDMHQNSPLLAYLEALPTSYDIDKDVILNQLSNDGSLFNPLRHSKCIYGHGKQRVHGLLSITRTKI
uniref:TPS23 n=1 Tax=Juglans sigillata TaxID=224355 RepID=A0A8K1B0K0_9ROSI|nr:TPS23 [Juglans sigillata]